MATHLGAGEEVKLEDGRRVRDDALGLDRVDERLEHGQRLDGAHVEAVHVLPD